VSGGSAIKAIRDVEIDGPYEVRNVLLRRDLPERGDYDPGPTILSAYRTKAYRAKDRRWPHPVGKT